MQGTITLIQVSRIETPAATGMVIGWVREYFRDAKWPQPPLPENVLGLVPCALLVTEIEGTDGSRTGEIEYSPIIDGVSG